MGYTSRGGGSDSFLSSYGSKGALLESLNLQESDPGLAGTSSFTSTKPRYSREKLTKSYQPTWKSFIFIYLYVILAKKIKTQKEQFIQMLDWMQGHFN